MPNIKFRRHLDPTALAFTMPEELDTIYIPSAIRAARLYFLRNYNNLSPEQLKEAADVYLQEFYPEVLAHETAHLVLGRIAEEDDMPVVQSMFGYHNPITEDIEHTAQTHAVAKALEHVFRRELNG